MNELNDKVNGHPIDVGILFFPKFANGRSRKIYEPMEFYIVKWAP